VWLPGTAERSVAAVQLTTPTSQRTALAALLAASPTLAVDFSILDIALPTIGADVGLGLADLQWIATTFVLCAAGLTLLAGRVTDLQEALAVIHHEVEIYLAHLAAGTADTLWLDGRNASRSRTAAPLTGSVASPRPRPLRSPVPSRRGPAARPMKISTRGAELFDAIQGLALDGWR